ncbi:V-set and immunoglobulin domain-containing protein 1-like [Etheostoma cragini]|uniref:V-set and immunoglobulin domain-containing protein 1-like n=1 Tax=Etheostoma cragini TaxID=417921 RepID=UPI00155F23CD|nr:V-set and immunoglobulin domain-containing protein 1-like [Etheostoma cragini]
MNHLVDLLCLCLLCLTGKTLCDKNGPAVINVERGADVVLPCSLSTKENIEFILFDWRKPPQKDEDLKEVFLYDAGIHYNNGRGGQSEEFKGRVSHFQDELKHGNASIIIRNTKISDSGEYSCYFPNLQPGQTFYIELVVVEPSKVIRVEEDSDVVLPCSLRTKEDITSGLFDWKKYEGLKEVFLYVEGKHYNNGLVGQSEEFKDRVSHFQDELKHGNASITIRTTRLADSGVYSCDFPNLHPRQTFYIKLDVIGAAPKPHVTILNQTKDRSLLQCEVHGDPEPEVEWRDSAGNTLPAEKTQVERIGNLFYITLRTTVIQTDRYRCVATQETISHQVSNEISVYFSGLSTGWIVFIVLALVLVLVLVGVLALMVLVKKGYITLHRNKEPKVIKVEQDRDVVLPCSLSTKEDITSELFDWKKPPQKDEGLKEVFYKEGKHYNNGHPGQSEEFKGRVSHFQDELKHGNASIIIRNTKISDSGVYSCYFPNIQTPQTFYVKLVVGRVTS